MRHEDSHSEQYERVCVRYGGRMEDADVLFCPRCGGDLAEREFYGVCARCADTLRATYDGSPRSDVEAAAYEPKMNVTPNAVASKE